VADGSIDPRALIYWVLRVANLAAAPLDRNSAQMPLSLCSPPELWQGEHARIAVRIPEHLQPSAT
jgi:hypothetical protein